MDDTKHSLPDGYKLAVANTEWVFFKITSFINAEK